jgi:thioredoxin 2
MTATTTLVCPHCGALNRLPPERPALQAKCGACHAALFDGHPACIDEAGLERHMHHDSIPVLLDVWAPWCGPCRAMAPMFEHAATVLEPQVRLLKLNADEAPRLCTQFGVRGIPAMFLFHGGRTLAQTAGARDANAIVGWVQQHLADPRQSRRES